MNENKEYFLIVFLNLFLSLLAIYLSPRFDIITLIYLLFINTIIFILLKLNEKNKNDKIKKKIEDIISLLHSSDTNINDYKISDDEFSKLSFEIVKIISEKRIITSKAIKNEQILREYTEDISHQLKTPLTGILLMLDLIEEDEENKKEYIKHIRVSTNRLNQLVDILLKLASLDSDMIKMKKESIAVKDLINEAINEIEILFKDKNYTILILGDDYNLICDRKWTYEAIFNILKNGVEASKDKGVKVYLKETNVYQSIIIEDYSKGMSNETLKKVYKRFYKENKNSKGYGIGLSIAKTVVEKQNGCHL